MNSLDARNPKFDPAWWRQHKANGADPNGAFESALKKYQAARKTLFNEAKNSQTTYVEELKAALDELRRAALAEKASNRLGTFQKETTEALSNYVRLIDSAKNELARLETAPIMKEGVRFLVKQVPQFQDYCKQTFRSESFNFLSLMYKGPIREKRWYEDFIKQGSKFEVNVSGATKNQFDDIAKAVLAGTKPDAPATWAKAPWDNAVREVENMVLRNIVPGFRNNYTGTMMTGRLP